VKFARETVEFPASEEQLSGVLSDLLPETGERRIVNTIECGHQSGHEDKKWLPTLDNLVIEVSAIHRTPLTSAG